MLCRMSQPVIIDCDPGIDDALALMLAAGSPELELLGVTCVAGNRPLDRTAPNACRVLDVAGASSVPVYGSDLGKKLTGKTSAAERAYRQAMSLDAEKESLAGKLAKARHG